MKDRLQGCLETQQTFNLNFLMKKVVGMVLHYFVFILHYFIYFQG